LSGASDTDCAQKLVGIERRLTQHFGQAAGGNATIHFHLPQAILRVRVTQREDRIALGSGNDARDAVPVAVDAHRLLRLLIDPQRGARVRFEGAPLAPAEHPAVVGALDTEIDLCRIAADRAQGFGHTHGRRGLEQIERRQQPRRALDRAPAARDAILGAASLVHLRDPVRELQLETRRSVTVRAQAARTRDASVRADQRDGEVERLRAARSRVARGDRAPGALGLGDPRRRARRRNEQHARERRGEGAATGSHFARPASVVAPA